MNDPTTTTAGAGQQVPGTSNDDFELTCFIVRQLTSRMETNRLVQVKAIHPGVGAPPSSGTVDVLPLVQQVDGSNNAKSHGTVYGIPVFRLQGGASAIVVDPAVGDIGYVAVCNRDISVIKKNKAEGPPGSGRTFDLADGVYVGGVLGDAPTQYIWLKNGTVTIADGNGNTIVLDASGITATDKFSHVLRMNSTGFALTGNLAVIGTITATGEVVRGFGGPALVTLGSHLHTSGGAGVTTSTPTAGT